MTASRLRAAAELLRTRAEAATAGPWEVTHDRHSIYSAARSKSGMGILGSLFAHGSSVRRVENADYIAMMSPPVAMALADWLDRYADIQPRARHVDRPAYSDLEQALALADAILGTPTTDTTTNEGRDE